MRGLILNIAGRWGHFKRPDTNNNPLTHDFITKTALIGMIGAVIGKDRNTMRALFPQLSDDLLYGVRLVSAVRKESHAFTIRKAVDGFKQSRRTFELLRDPRFHVAVALVNERSAEVFEDFSDSVLNSKAVYTPVLGLHNCPAELELLTDGEFSESRSGSFKANCFVSQYVPNSKSGHKLVFDVREETFRIGFEKIPTFQDGNFYNPPERYAKVIYPDAGHNITVEGEYYEFSKTGARWWLV